TEKRLDSLTEKVEELAAAQARTEKHLDSLTEKVEELAAAQARTEKRLDSLTEKVEELAAAQTRTEKSLEELVAAQARTEKRLDSTNKQLGGLSATVGYTLENEAYKHLPELLQNLWNIKPLEKLYRGYLSTKSGKDIEINILGKALKDSTEILIVGESKTQLSRKEVDRFIEKVVPQLDTGKLSPFPVFVTHMETSRGVSEYARQKGAAVFFSFQF
ncbi:MAG: chordopoxvirus fusion protein, partial [Spirochaetes bacterium]